MSSAQKQHDTNALHDRPTPISQPCTTSRLPRRSPRICPRSPSPSNTSAAPSNSTTRTCAATTASSCWRASCCPCSPPRPPRPRQTSPSAPTTQTTTSPSRRCRRCRSSTSWPRRNSLPWCAILRRGKRARLGMTRLRLRRCASSWVVEFEWTPQRWGGTRWLDACVAFRR
jgi:hypothetical protein